MPTHSKSHFLRRLLCAVALLTTLTACSSKLKDEYDFRPYIASWIGKNCGKGQYVRCDISEGFAAGYFDDDDFVYGVAYVDSQQKRRIVYVKVAAEKPYDRTVVGDEPAAEKE